MIITREFKTPKSLILHTLELLREKLQKSGNMMLSGGSTPYAIYNQIAAAPSPVHPDRKLFLSDERMVPVNSPMNNAHNLMPMLRALDCESRFIRVDTELDPQVAADQFSAYLDPLKHIDLGFLGMGPDGHTAGVFTPKQAAMKDGDLTFHTVRPDGMHGISVTPTLFNRIEQIILLVTGESKREIIHTLISNPETIPAGMALSDHPNVELWADIVL